MTLSDLKERILSHFLASDDDKPEARVEVTKAGIEVMQAKIDSKMEPGLTFTPAGPAGW